MDMRINERRTDTVLQLAFSLAQKGAESALSINNKIQENSLPDREWMTSCQSVLQQTIQTDKWRYAKWISFDKKAFKRLAINPTFKHYVRKSSMDIFEARDSANPAIPHTILQYSLSSNTAITNAFKSCSSGTYSSISSSVLPCYWANRKSDNSPPTSLSLSCSWIWQLMSCSYAGNKDESCHPIPISLMLRNPYNEVHSWRWVVRFNTTYTRLHLWRRIEVVSTHLQKLLCSSKQLCIHWQTTIQVISRSTIKISNIIHFAQRRCVNSSWNINTAARKNGRCDNSLNTIPEEIT